MKKGNVIGVILIFIGIAWIIRQTGVININWMASVKVFQLSRPYRFYM